MNFFQKIWAWLTGEVSKAQTIEQSIAKFATKVVDELKTNPEVILVEDGLIAVATAVDPALVPMIKGLELELPNILTIISNGAVELAKPLPYQAKDVLAWLNKVEGNSKSVFAGILAAINGAVQYFTTSNNGIEATPGQLIATGQVMHAQPAQ